MYRSFTLAFLDLQMKSWPSFEQGDIFICSFLVSMFTGESEQITLMGFLLVGRSHLMRSCSESGT